MCGVFAIFATSLGIEEKRELTKQALAQLQHRGPDAWGVYNSPKATLGHVRLSIVDVAAGHQPMVSGDQIVSFNGEIFNHVELRAELESQGVVFETRSDTEVILKLYQRDGIDCFRQFNGQFAIIIWDKREQRLIAARDRYGIRPLYLLPYRGGWAFSSEMKAFDCLPGFRRSFSPAGLLEHGLLWNTLGETTVYNDVRSVESGTVKIFATSGEEQTRRYYQLGEELSARRDQFSSFEQAQEGLTQALSDAVTLRLRSDVPVGAYLSGGIDSTVISRLVKDATNHDFRTFSVAFEDESLDESLYQKMASEDVNSQHNEVRVSRQNIADSIADTVRHTERPIFRTAPTPLYLLSDKVQQERIKVVLTGEGADEILCGYDAFKELKILEAWKKNGYSPEVEGALRDLYPHLAHYSDPKHFGLIRLYYEGFLDDYDNEMAGLNIRFNNNKILERYLNPDFGLQVDKDRMRERIAAQLPADFKHWTLMQRNSFLEMKTLLQGYLLSSQGDRMALSHGVEGRFPFLDHQVVEQAFAMPDEYKLRGFEQKAVLREAFTGKIPQQIIDRPKRPYMAPDLISFIDDSGNLQGMAAEMMNDQAIRDAGLFNHEMVAKFLKKFKRGVPKDIGYRDNMIFTFIYSTQLCHYWLNKPVQDAPDYGLCTVDIVDTL
ncbi:asparagine synthase (glutamine-hydrolyzing) [Teredinibacter turnerae]|uniref:asparagine synthase (glutamine-hydrolyzing) n=1 Tax=Teredinibacter turnerae TaxID=2426 RepID=UPI0004131F64|nr:asparagine synthase (glutamine-hydrolyzing) [Teredinibacter turnerae]